MEKEDHQYKVIKNFDNYKLYSNSKILSKNGDEITTNTSPSGHCFVKIKNNKNYIPK